MTLDTNNPGNQNINILKYSLILLTASGLSIVAYINFTPFHWIVSEASQTAYTLHQQWNSYSHSWFSWQASLTYLFTLLAGLVLPFALTIVAILHFANPSWLPENDHYFTTPIKNWLNLCLISFIITLCARALETVGFI